MIAIDRKNFLDALAFAKVSGKALDLMITPSINYKVGVLNIQSPILKEVLDVIVYTTHIDVEKPKLFTFNYIEKHTTEGNFSSILLIGLDYELDLIINFETIGDEVLEVKNVVFKFISDNTIYKRFEEIFDTLTELDVKTRQEILSSGAIILKNI